MTQAKAQNSIKISNKPDQSLPRAKILRGKRSFQRLFERSTLLRKPPLHCRYRVYKNPDMGSKFGFIAPKKILRRAVDRNRAKRLLRETFRINQHFLPDTVLNNEIGFHAVFIANSNNLSYSGIEKSMVSLLKVISDRLAPNGNPAADNNHLKTD